uniref:Uncharacterized protein n=1 Tax=Avena sativa TaxID=4498 RepID=A0ACD5VMJ4_AVESA
MAREGETVVAGSIGGKSLDAQERLAQGRSHGGQTRKEQLREDGYRKMGHKGGETRKEQLEEEGYREMGHKGGETRSQGAALGEEGYRKMGQKRRGDPQEADRGGRVQRDGAQGRSEHQRGFRRQVRCQGEHRHR